MGSAEKVVLLVDGANGLENMDRLNFKDSLQIVDFNHAMEHAGVVLAALLGSKEHPRPPNKNPNRNLLGLPRFESEWNVALVS